MPAECRSLIDSVLDIIYVALALSVFALIALAASGVERMGPRTRTTAHPDDGEEDRP